MHPALGGGFGPGYKIRYGRDLVGDHFDQSKGIPPKPDGDPMDSCKPTKEDPGHGTHLAGIIAGKSESFTGVAPDAILGMWRVHSCSKDTTDEIIVEAIFEAYDTGVDIISLSLGPPFIGWPESVLSVAVKRVNALGVPVISAAANEGGYGAFTVSSPSVGKGVLCIASFDNGYNLASDGQVAAVTTRNLVSDFSSLGGSFEIDFMPNIAGIGGYVFSTLPRAAGSWGILSGTSMAAPYVAGTVALYLKSLEGGIARPTPTYILEQFQNYTCQAYNTPGQNNIETPYRQGAGLVQVYDTIQQHVHITPGDISFDDTYNIQKTHILTIANDGNSVVSYQLVNKVSVSAVPYGLSPSAYLVEPPQYGQDFASLMFSAETIEIQPGSSIAISVTVIPPTADPKLHIMYGGFIQFKDLHGQRDLTVPYIGIVGNQRELPIFGNGTPFMTDSTYPPYQNVLPSHVYEANETFIFDQSISKSGPVFGFLLPNPTREIIAALYTQDKVQIGLAFTDLVNLPRSHIDGMIYTLQWDGTYTPNLSDTNIPVKVPVLPGNYRIAFKALKWLGNPDNQSDREVWISPIIQFQ